MGASEVRERTGGTQRRPLRTSLRPLSLHVHSLAQRRLSLHIHSGAVGVTVKVTCSLAGAAYHHHKDPTVEMDTQHCGNSGITGSKQRYGAPASGNRTHSCLLLIIVQATDASTVKLAPRRL